MTQTEPHIAPPPPPPPREITPAVRRAAARDRGVAVPHWAAALLALLALLLALYALKGWLAQRHTLRYGQKIDGTVREVERKRVKQTYEVYYTLGVAYQANGATHHRSVDLHGVAGDVPKTGDTITIFIDPKDPERAVVAGATDTLAAVLTLPAILAAIAALLWLLAHRRKRTVIATWATGQAVPGVVAAVGPTPQGLFSRHVTFAFETDGQRRSASYVVPTRVAANWTRGTGIWVLLPNPKRRAAKPILPAIFN